MCSILSKITKKQERRRPGLVRKIKVGVTNVVGCRLFEEVHVLFVHPLRGKCALSSKRDRDVCILKVPIDFLNGSSQNFIEMR